MRRLGALCALTACVAVPQGCEGERTAEVGLALTAPQGVLDDAAEVKLSVFPAGKAQCGADGSATVPAEAKDFKLERCDAGFCGELTLERDESTQMFYVQVNGGGALLAQGCATAKINQDPVEVDIKVQRFVPPSCCGDGVLQAGELCDTGPVGGECSAISADHACETDCSGKEIPVDFVGTSGGAMGQTGLALTFAGGEAELNGALRAVWQTDAGVNADIGVRYLRSDLSALTTPPPYALPQTLRLDCDGSPSPFARAQSVPAVAALGSTVVVAFVSNFTAPLRYDVQAVDLPATGCNTTSATNVSSTMNAANATSVDVAAGSAGTALIVWEQGGQILGSLYTPPGMPGGNGGGFVIAPSGRTPKVAGAAAGWVVTYQGADTGDDDGVFVRTVSASQVVGAATSVAQQTSGTQDQPDIAMLPDGRFAVTFRSAGDVFAQRFGADGAAIAGDQDAPLQASSDGEQSAPSIGGAGEFFAVAWEDATSGGIRARLLGGSGGFLFNAISGQNDDFPVTAGAVTPRKPAIATGTYLVFGWEDLGAAQPGMYVRRFPLP